MQNTLKSVAEFIGTGLHSGKPVRMKVRPAPVDHGIVFRRTDLPVANAMIAVRPENWVEANLCTLLRNSAGARIGTVEHVLAALAGCGIHNALIEVDAPEIPILDGSAAPFVARFMSVGAVGQRKPLKLIKVLRDVELRHGHASARIAPSDALRLSFEIDFADPAIGRQSADLSMVNGSFVRELSDCRTFCMRAEVDTMRANGLALGGTLENAVVFDGGSVLSPGGLRRADEPVRHKMLDAMGDLSVAGAPILGHYHGNRAGHALTGRLVQALMSDPRNFSYVTCTDELGAVLPGAGLDKHDLPLSA